MNGIDYDGSNLATRDDIEDAALAAVRSRHPGCLAGITPTGRSVEVFVLDESPPVDLGRSPRVRVTARYRLDRDGRDDRAVPVYTKYGPTDFFLTKV